MRGLRHRLLIAMGRGLLTGAFKLEKVAELVILTLIKKIITVDLAELIIMSEDLDFVGDQTFKPVVMTLDDQLFDYAKIFTASAISPALHLRKNKVVVAIGEYAGDGDSLLYGNLVVMSVDCKAPDTVLLCDLQPGVVIIQHKVDLLSRRLVALLGRSGLLRRLLVVLGWDGALTRLKLLVAHHGLLGPLRLR